MSLLVTKAAVRRAGSAAEFGKVAVLLGGDSTEREISLLSGNQSQAVQRAGAVGD